MGTRVCSCVRVRSRAGADRCRSTRHVREWGALSSEGHPSMEHAHTQCTYTQRMHVSTSMRGWLHRCTGRRCGPHTRAPRAASVRARVCVCDWAPKHPRRTVRARSVGVDRGWVGAQAFYEAKAFNVNIGAWNTAAVTTLAYVCAAFSARAAHHRGRDALGGTSVRRGPLCAAAPPMRALACVR